ncbi:GroES-like protein [Daedalea quercina L-15889]|uniref:alcohol dehydrogenase n=1 Tax=Daedalea quercina L-15889 TaxID=1314783 RepID=A0A165RUI6_9APHY|nr:GroES-like protein [Daedalea quercina L-15889]
MPCGWNPVPKARSYVLVRKAPKDCALVPQSREVSHRRMTMPNYVSMTSIEAIPATTRAAVTREFSMIADVADYPLKQPSELAPGECILKLECTGVCHTDLHFMNGEWRIVPRLPSVGGHEGVGRVVAIGAHSKSSVIKLGDRVGTKYVVGSCLQCEMCRRGFEQNCADRVISGYQVDGTFAQYMVAYLDHLIPIPDELPSVEAAPILCAGVTVYNILKQLTDTPPGSWVVVHGAGGGLGHLGVQYAKAFGYRVLAIDSGTEKRDLCLSVGAEKFLDFKESANLIADVKALTDPLGAHAALVTTHVGAAYVQAGFYVRAHGTVMCIGAAQEVSGLPMALIIDQGIKYIASQTGGRQAVYEALSLAAQGKVRCHVVQRPLEEINSIFEDMHKGQLAGRAVVTF